MDDVPRCQLSRARIITHAHTEERPMTTDYIPTECEVALLRLRASTPCTCDDCQQSDDRLRATADADAKRCKVVLTQLVQRELSILCTD